MIKYNISNYLNKPISNSMDIVNDNIKSNSLKIWSPVWHNVYGSVEEVINNIWDNLLTISCDHNSYKFINYKAKSNILKAFK